MESVRIADSHCIYQEVSFFFVAFAFADDCGIMGESEYKARERAAIVSKYAQRTPEILPGEEGPENVTNIDLYGFI